MTRFPARADRPAVRVGTITQLWRYPVKSMAGESLPAAALSWRGIPGDRGWAVFDETRQGITGGKRLPVLRSCRARYATEPVSGEPPPPAEIAFPDGARALADSQEAARRLSELAGRPLTLRSLGPAGAESAPRITLEGEPPDTVRQVMGILPGEPMPDLSELSGERLRLLRQGNFFDALPIHLLSLGTLRTLERLAPASRWDPRRFRPNVLIETDADDYPELAWLGRRVRFGQAVIEVVMGCPRCVMVTQATDDLPRDTEVMRTLVRETRHTAGIYAGVAREGEMRVGDPVEVLDS